MASHFGGALKIATLNVRGFRNKKKRKVLLHRFKREKYDVICIQDTHLTASDEYLIKKEWHGDFHFSKGTNKQNGLLTLFNKNTVSNIDELLLSSDRILISQITVEELTLFIINIYGPCNLQEKKKFLETLNNEVTSIYKKFTSDNIIVCGDFNIVINNDLDIISGNPHHSSIVTNFKNRIDSLQLNDSWRLLNGNRKQFSWSSNSPFTARRLDYIFVTDSLFSFCTSSNILNLGFSDHNAVILDLNFSTFKRGTSCYKFNVKLLSRADFVNEAKKEIKRINETELEPVLKWEYIKSSIKSLGKTFGKAYAAQRKDKIFKITEDIKSIEQKLVASPSNEDLLKRFGQLKTELEVFALAESEGARIRAGQKWAEDGEKSTKFFLNLEKQRSNSNTIFRLKSKDSNHVYSDCTDILNELETFYSNLYKNNLQNENVEDELGFFKKCENKYLDEYDVDYLDGVISENEVLDALKRSSNGSAPGLDGLPAEVYKFFWNDIRLPLMKCFYEVLREGQLSNSQRLGVICLHFKGKGLDREKITNWRPISLTNFDYKLLAKTFATRLGTCIEKCIDIDQYAFIKGRNISDMIREIDDTIEYSKLMNSKSIILSIDYAKAFDTLSLTAIIKSLKYYGFGEVFINNIKTLLKNRESCVRNGGHMSNKFQMERGVRQGCPISPLLFILTSELLAKHIRKDNNIKGIPIPGKNYPIKIKMYADDTTFFLRDNIDYREVLSKIKSFSQCTGLNLNKNKSFAMVMSDISFKNTIKFGIKFVNKINILGIYFSNECRSDEILETVDKKITQLIKVCAMWSKRNIGIIGKITLLKTFGLSLFNYIMQSIGISEKKLKEINSIMFSFIWKNDNNKKSIEKVKREVLCMDYANGGLKMFDMLNVQDSYLLNWGERLLCEEISNWDSLPIFFYRKVGGKIVFESNVRSVDFKGINLVENKFWRKVLTKWLDSKNVYIDDDNEQRENQISTDELLFNNKNITFKGKVIFKEKCIRKGICRIKDIFLTGSVISYHGFLELYGNCPETLLVYNIIFNSVSRITNRLVNEAEQNNQCSDNSFGNKNNILFRDLVVGEIGRKNFLLALKPRPQCIAFNYWEREMTQFDKSDNVIWMRSFQCTKESYLRCLQWKIIHRIYPSGTVLKRMKLRESDSCVFCLEIDTLTHFFHGCKVVKPIWSEVERKIEKMVGKRIIINHEIAMFGIEMENQKENIYANKLILVAKASISELYS